MSCSYPSHCSVIALCSQMHFCIWRTHPKLMHEALYEYTRLQLRGRTLTKPLNLAQQLVVRLLCTLHVLLTAFVCWQRFREAWHDITSSVQPTTQQILIACRKQCERRSDSATLSSSSMRR